MEIEDATFCPYCAKPLHLKPKPAERKESFPRIAGMLTIFGSFSALAMGLLYLFSAGLSVFGMCLLVVCGIVFSTTVNPAYFIGTLMVGEVPAGSVVPIALMTTSVVLTLITPIASMVLIALSKSEFS